jgi:hypothetical protein
VPDPDKAFGEHMEEEATDKLEGRQLDASVRSGLLIVPGPEGHRLSIEGKESFPCSKASHKPSRNFPRTIFARARTGTRKSFLAGIH